MGMQRRVAIMPADVIETESTYTLIIDLPGYESASQTVKDSILTS